MLVLRPGREMATTKGALKLRAETSCGSSSPAIFRIPMTSPADTHELAKLRTVVLESTSR